MPIGDEDILQVLREATESLFPSEITSRLNAEFGARATVDEVATRLTRLKQGVGQLPDGRWTVKRRLASNGKQESARPKMRDEVARSPSCVVEHERRRSLLTRRLQCQPDRVDRG